MRIISGSAAGVILKVPRGLAVRPTPDLVRQAIFNSLGDRVAASRVLELFAGTGALSLECLSRGAEQAVCVEKASRHATVLRQNRKACGFSAEQLAVRGQDVFQALRALLDQGETFGLIFADPPFGEKNIGKRSTSMAQKLLDTETLPPLLDPDGLFLLGHARRDTVSLPSFWRERQTLKHGDSLIRILERA